MSKSIVITSGKGGTGKSMFATNIGVVLAEMGKKVVLIDLNMGLRSLDLYLGVENEVVYDLGDVLTGRCGIRQSLIKPDYIKNFALIAASPESCLDEITPAHMEVLVNKLKSHFDYIIIDAPPGIDYGLKVATGGADEAILVSSPEFAAVRDAEAVIRELNKYGVTNNYLILNKVRRDLMEHEFVPTVDTITRQMRLEVLGLISYDDNIHISTNMGVPIGCKEGTYIKRNFISIANRVIKG